MLVSCQRHVEAWTPLYSPRRKLMLKIWKHGRKYQKYVHVLLKYHKLTFEKQIDCNWKVWCIMNDARCLKISAYPGNTEALKGQSREVMSLQWVLGLLTGLFLNTFTQEATASAGSVQCEASVEWLNSSPCAGEPIHHRENSFLPLLSAVSFCHLWKN